MSYTQAHSKPPCMPKQMREATYKRSTKATAAPSPTLTPSSSSYDGKSGGKKDAVVIGAGPAGLAVSIGLAQRGYSVQCFEKLDDPRQDTPELAYGLVCDEARAGNALRLLGFSTEEIKEHGVTIPRGTGCSINPPGGTVRRFGASIDQMQERNPCLYFPRQSLLCLLMEKLQQYDNAQLFCGVSVECKLRDGKTQAPVVTWLGDQGKSQITPHLLVGADGINSVVRSALQEHPSYDFSIERYFAWSQLNSFKAFRVESKKLIHPSLPNSEIVQPESLVGIFSTIEDPSDKRKFRFVCLPESEDGIRRIVPDGVGSDLLSEMQSVDDVYQLLKDNFPFLNVDDTFERTEVERIINGRRGIKPQPACPNSLAAIFDQEGSAAVLIGDSAHQTPPDLMQGTLTLGRMKCGANSSLEDAMEFCKVLDEQAGGTGTGSYSNKAADAASSVSTTAVVKEYEKRRKPEVKALMQLNKFGIPAPEASRLTWIIFLIDTRVRRLLNRIAPRVFSPPAPTMLAQGYSFTDALAAYNRTTVMLYCLLLAGIVAFGQTVLPI